jgi:hypothetical protein
MVGTVQHVDTAISIGHDEIADFCRVSQLSRLNSETKHLDLYCPVVCWRRYIELGALVPNLVDLFDEIYNESQLLH